MEQSVSATLYPKRIIIATMISDIHGSVWADTDCLSILPSNVPEEELGTIVIRHIAISEAKDLSKIDMWDMRARYRSLAKFKTEGQLMKNSKLVKIILADNQLRFEPKDNRYSETRRHYYGYYPLPDKKFNIQYPCSNEEVGAGLRRAWDLAIIT
ncbi:MAG: hypothetical protein QM768_19245 [Agriterribacter sp.]